MMVRWRTLGLKVALGAAMSTLPAIATAQTVSGNSIAGEWDGHIPSLNQICFEPLMERRSHRLRF